MTDLKFADDQSLGDNEAFEVEAPQALHIELLVGLVRVLAQLVHHMRLELLEPDLRCSRAQVRIQCRKCVDDTVT